jgi:hypothetical protein
MKMLLCYVKILWLCQSCHSAIPAYFLTSDKDSQFLKDSLARWWKIPTINQEESFTERVSIIVADDEMSVDEARKIVLDKIIYR